MASLDDPAKAPYFLDTCDTDTKTSTVNTLKEVINAINARKPKQWKGEFSVNNMGKVTIKLHRGEGILLDYNLANLLGFQSSKYLFVDGKIILPKKKGGLNKDDDDDDDDSDRGDTNTFTIGRDSTDEQFFGYHIPQAEPLSGEEKENPVFSEEDFVSSTVSRGAANTAPSRRGLRRSRRRPSSSRGNASSHPYDTRNERRPAHGERQGDIVPKNPPSLSRKTVPGDDDVDAGLESFDPDIAVNDAPNLTSPATDNITPRQLYRVVAEKFPDLRNDKYHIYIYSNLPKHTMVGHTQVPLLRCLPIKPQQQGQFLSKSFDRLQYRPLSSNFFQYIQIIIADDAGQEIPFTWGRVVCTIHIRKRRKSINN